MPARKKKPEKDTPDLPGAAHSLRTDAEKRLLDTKESFSGPAGQDAGKIAHELSVHRIELEIQNEALREAQLALTDSRDKYLDLFEFAPLGYFTFTAQGLIAEVNLTGATLLGVERQRLVHGRFSRYVAASDAGAWPRYFMSVLETGEKQVCTLTLVRGDGLQVPARLESIRIPGEGGDPVVRMAVSDVTLQKQAEDELARRNEEVRAKNVQLTHIGDELRENETRLTATLEEKEILLSEIHHRVKNNLAAFISLLALDGTYEDSEAGRRLRKDLLNRARSMALIHETLYRTGQYSEVSMDVYLLTLVEQVVKSYGSERLIKTIVEAKGVMLDLPRATPVGLIVNELITNSLKYAFPGGKACYRTGREKPCTIRIAMTKENNSYRLTVCDNGVGMPAGFDPLTAKTLGLKLVTFLAKHQMRATIEVKSENGTKFVFRFTE